MTPAEILAALHWKPHDSPNHPAWPFFLLAMRTREYGGSALLDAWVWFRAGWEAAP